MKTSLSCRTILLLLGLGFTLASGAQQITGTWKGKINGLPVELKLVKSGDSLVGSSVYYNTKNNFRRYSVKGYFDQETNDVIWWDDVLLEDHLSGKTGGIPLLSVADFNCPGEGILRLDGSSSLRDDKEKNKGSVQLQKTGGSAYPDQWDWVIDNYTAGANDPSVIDSIALLVGGPKYFPEERLPALAAAPGPAPAIAAPQPAAVASTRPSTNQEKFARRQNKLQLVVPVNSPVIELRFYDNAIIDGDSIAIFLNGHLVREHILLGAEAQTITLRSEDLNEDNELVMLAENLGSIPPNTAYLVVEAGRKRYEARLFADEGSSALVRFIKEKKQ